MNPKFKIGDLVKHLNDNKGFIDNDVEIIISRGCYTDDEHFMKVNYSKNIFQRIDICVMTEER